MSNSSVFGRTMKLAMIFLVTLLLFGALVNTDARAGAAPFLINYQGRLLDSDGNPVNGTVPVVFAIYSGPVTATELWSEERLITNMEDGALDVVLGLDTPIPDSVFADSIRFLGITIGMDDELRPRTRLVSVPYAYRVSTIDGASATSLVVLGSENDSVVIDPSKGYALHVTDENGDVRCDVGMTTSDAAASFYDPVDRSNPGLTGVGKLRVRIDNEGILMFGDTETDTNIIVKPDGNVTGRGRLVMGQDCSGSDNWSTVLGYNNSASGDSSTVSGGSFNTASGTHAIISGGRQNTSSGYASTTCGGSSNSANGDYSAIGGGKSNVASGEYSAVTGGFVNAAGGDYSIAMGSEAKANHDGSIVIAADSMPAGDSVISGGSGQIVLRADGGVYFTSSGGSAPYAPTKLINTSTGAYLSAAGSWRDDGQKDHKENFKDLDPQLILEMLSRLPVSTWNYKVEDDWVKHVGPTAEDFYRIFGIGVDDESISSSDLAGVALVAIQELHRENAGLKAEISELRTMLERLESHVNDR